jgi:hypothetical protein
VETKIESFIDAPLIQNDMYSMTYEDYDKLYDIPKQILDTICEYYTSGKWKDQNLIINSFAGSGKTFMIARFLSSIITPEVSPFVYMTLNHQVSSEFFKNYVANGGTSCYYIRGKGSVNEHGEPLECTDPTGFNIVKKYGKNLWYCQDGKCPQFNVCPHQQNISNMLTEPNPPSFCGHFLLYPTLYREIVKKKYRNGNYILVFDEDMSNSFCVHEQFSRDSLMEAIRYTENVEIKEVFELMIEGWDKFISFNPKEHSDRMDVERKYTEIIHDALILIDIEELDGEIGLYDNKIKENYGTPQELNYKNPIEFLDELRRFIDNYQSHMKKHLPMTFMTISRNIIGFDYFRIIRESNGVIILNATFEPEICYKLFKPNTTFIEKSIIQSIKKYQNVYRIHGREDDERYGTYGLRSLLFKNEPTEKLMELVDVAKLFSLKHKKTIIFCVNRLFPHLKKILYDDLKLNPESVKLDTYAWAIGKNDYQKFDGCICFGTPFHNVEHFNKMMDLYNVSEEIMYRNDTIFVLIQSIHRIRPLSWKEDQRPCEILLLSSVPIEKYIKFEDGHKIRKLTLREMAYEFNRDFIPNPVEPLLKYITDNNVVSLREMERHMKVSRKTLLNYIKILVDKEFIFETQLENNEKGRPQRYFEAYSVEHRTNYQHLENLKYELGNTFYDDDNFS